MNALPIPLGMVGAPVTSHIENTELRHRVRVLPGDARTVSGPLDTLMTVLGSCISACIRNPHNGFGGMNHFMLPESDTGEWNGVNAAMRYGNYAMEALINAVLKSGCARKDLEIKIFGGANLGFRSSSVGTKNVDFVLDYLKAENLEIAAWDLGGNCGRRVFYRPSTGRVRLLHLKSQTIETVAKEERKYAKALKQEPVSGSVELF